MNADRRSPLVAALVAAWLVAGCLSTTTLVADVQLGSGVLHPMPFEKAPDVKTTPDAAKAKVLEGVAGGNWPVQGVAWRDGDCVLVALFEPHPMSMAPNPGAPYPVYLVRLWAGAVGHPEWFMVDASTGELGAAIGIPRGLECAAGT